MVHTIHLCLFDSTGRTEMNQTSFVDVTIVSSTATPTLTPTLSQTSTASFLLDLSTAQHAPSEAAVSVELLNEGVFTEPPSMFSASMAPPTVAEVSESELESEVMPTTASETDNMDEDVVTTTETVFDITDFLEQDLSQREVTPPPRGDVFHAPAATERAMSSPTPQEQGMAITTTAQPVTESEDDEEDHSVIVVGTIQPDVLFTASPTEPKFAEGKTEETILTGFTTEITSDLEGFHSTVGESDTSASGEAVTEASTPDQVVDTSHKPDHMEGTEQSIDAPESPVSTSSPVQEASTTAYPDYGPDYEIGTQVLVEGTPPIPPLFEIFKEMTTSAESVEQTDTFTTAPVTELSTFTTFVCDTDTPSVESSTTTEPVQETTLPSHDEESSATPAVEAKAEITGTMATSPEVVESTGSTAATEKSGTTAVADRSSEESISDITEPSPKPVTEDVKTPTDSDSEHVPSPSMSSAVLETTVQVFVDNFDDLMGNHSGKDCVHFIT